MEADLVHLLVAVGAFLEENPPREYDRVAGDTFCGGCGGDILDKPHTEDCEWLVLRARVTEALRNKCAGKGEVNG